MPMLVYADESILGMGITGLILYRVITAKLLVIMRKYMRCNPAFSAIFLMQNAPLRPKWARGCILH